MKKILFLLLIIITFLTSCEVAESETSENVQQEIVQQEVEAPKEIPFIPVDPNRASLEFLRKLEGKYPVNSKLFETEPIKARLEKLLAHKYMDFIQRMEVQMPIRVQGDLAIMRGTMTNGGRTEEAALVVDISKNLMWVALLQNGKEVLHYNEDGNIKMPIPLFELIMSWNA